MSRSGIILALIAAITVIVIAAVAAGGKMNPDETGKKPEKACTPDVRSCIKCSGFGKICDKRWGFCLGGPSGGRLRHAAAAGDADSSWQLLPLANGSAFICDENNSCIVGGGDGIAYHQLTNVDSAQSRWRVTGVGDSFYLCNEASGKCLAGGQRTKDNPDGLAYLVTPSGDNNLKWRISNCDRLKVPNHS